LLNKRPSSPIKWENDSWDSEHFNWSSYFGDEESIEE